MKKNIEMIFVTGAAGFIGFHLCRRLLQDGHSVVGYDSINDYYDTRVKYARLGLLGIDRSMAEKWKIQTSGNLIGDFTFVRGELEDYTLLDELFRQHSFSAVVNLAAQAGVRYSLINPQAYIKSNIVGFSNILEVCRHYKVGHLAYASSSSVYGLNEKMPLSTKDNVDHPVSLYAATKKSNELMAHTYSHLFGLPTTGLRFFTVYGPWGRPDMALFLFTEAILKGEPIKVFNHGKMVRDFTYVDDIVEGIVRVVAAPPKGDPEWSGVTPEPGISRAPFKIYNIGNNDPVKLMEFVEAIEKKLGKQADRIMMDLQPGDVPATYADVTDLMADLGYKPSTPLKEGIDKFVDWYREFYEIKVER
ncbi:NAD-dependent epimerase [Neolewinella persica]|uniref:NAD-dependent epimerase n=1 Tax=Neolewinella persica TaxID=70998 RepID=UPI00035D4F02|nr:NAD-dependent epimerase [Neolewinella persica]